MKKTKSTRLLDTLYETASDLHGCGLLTDTEMQTYQETAPLEFKASFERPKPALDSN